MNEKEQQLYEYYKNNIDFNKNKINKIYNFNLIVNELINNAYKDFSELLISYIKFINIKEKKEKRQDYFNYVDDFYYDELSKKRPVEHNDFKIDWLYKYDNINGFMLHDTILREVENAKDFYITIDYEMFRFFIEEFLHFILLGYLFLNTNETIEQVKEKMYKIFININTINYMYLEYMFRYSEMLNFYKEKEKTDNYINYDEWFNNWEIKENTKKERKE